MLPRWRWKRAVPSQMLQCRGLNAHARPQRDRQAPAASAGQHGAALPVSKSSPLGGFADYVWSAQARLCAQFEELDGGGGGRRALFAEDPWTREDGSGRGSTRVLTGSVWEKAACNVSVLSGVLTPQRAATMSQRGRPGVDPQGGQAYSAVALSLVFHARNPNLSTFRADIRAFAVEGCDPFFGGGADLTPAYVYDEDAADWHTHWAGVCDAHQPAHAPPRALYRYYKDSCDYYFFLPARKEHRGIGGLFFDDVPPRPSTDSAAALSPLDGEAFARAVCENWIPGYAPIVARRAHVAFGERERQWQLQRRGRYLEFNLLYDRGVRFGLDTGRIESIMVSAPPLVRCGSVY
jgi:coproporphyrinogen III oxidase